MVDTFDDGPIDHEARSITQLMKDGDHVSAANKLQEDARCYRPGEFTELVGQVRALSKAQNTLSHLEIEPMQTPDGDPRGKLNVSMITPALDNFGRQYVDQSGRPLAVIEPIAQIDNHQRTQVIDVCPRILMPPPPCHIERPWLRIDERRERVRFELGTGGFDLSIRIDGGRDYERRPTFPNFRPPFGFDHNRHDGHRNEHREERKR